MKVVAVDHKCQKNIHPDILLFRGILMNEALTLATDYNKNYDSKYDCYTAIVVPDWYKLQNQNTPYNIFKRTTEHKTRLGENSLN